MPNTGRTPIPLILSDEEKLRNKVGVTAAQHFSQPQPQTRCDHYSDHARGDPALIISPTQGFCASSHATISVETALRIISDQTPAPVAVDSSVTTSIIGSVIAEDVYAATMVPVYRTSVVSGYAVTVEEGKIMKDVFPRASIINARLGGSLQHLRPGTIARITTGTPIPPNANAIIRSEDTATNGSENDSIEILADDISIDENVREPGSHFPLNSQIFTRGDFISPVSGAVSLLALAGIQTVKVFEKPRVGVLSICDKLVGISNSRQICQSTRLAVLSGLFSLGFEAIDLGILRHTPDGELEQALRSTADVLLIAGDIFSDELNLRPTIENTLGGSIHFNRVSMKPGSHLTFATIPVNAAETASQERTSRLIFWLPSDPTSALVALNLFVLPSLQKLSGLGESSHVVTTKPWMAPQLGLPRVAVVLTHHFPLDPKHTEYHLAVVTGSRSDARLYATSISAESVVPRGSHASGSTKANAIIILRAGQGVGIKGEIVEGLLMGPVYGSDTRLIC